MSKFKPQALRLVRRYAMRGLLNIAILSFFILHANQNTPWGFIQALENKAYDVRVRLTLPNQLDPRIVIVDIDEKSLKEIGHWPWNRAVLAKLLDQLFDTYHIDVLGMDVVFAEPDESSGLKKLEQLAQGPLQSSREFLDALTGLKSTLDYDNLFVQSMRNRRVVLGYIFTSSEEIRETAQAGQLPKAVVSSEDVKSYQLSYESGDGYAANLPKFQESARAAGHFNFVPDADGIVRKVPLLYGYQGALYEFLALAVARVALNVEHIKLGFYRQGSYANLEYLQIGDRQIPVDREIETWVPYRGKPHNFFPYVSATDVLHGRITEVNLLKNKIVLLGTTAQGLLDLRATPIESVYPGVEVHANLISGILDRDIRYNLPYENAVEVLLLLAVGIMMTAFLPISSPLAATLGTFVLAGGVVWFNMWLWNVHQVVFPIATTLLLMLSLFVFNMSYGYFVETRNKSHLMRRFGQYVPPDLVEEMSKNPEQQFSMEAESREMTVLFSDVRDFTSLSEGLEPKELSELMNEYLSPMTSIIHEHLGTIDKYMGDAIMAFWGAPLRDPQHARHAVDAAMKMMQHLQEIQLRFKQKGWPVIKIGIGLNTGVMSVGNMGSEFRMAYTVLGDAVNLGSRLEGLTKSYGVPIVISETTKVAVPEYLYRELDLVRVKGKERPVTIFEPIGLKEIVAQEESAEIAAYQNALQNYRQQNWQMALAQFAKLHEQAPTRKLYSVYLERIRHFMQNPPGAEWDGVYTHQTK